MWGRGFILFLMLLSLSYGTVSAQSFEVYTELLEEGKRAVEEGHTEQALELWSAQAERSGDEITDPRIGISYIELVTQQQNNELYERAVDMYYWGLRNPADPAFEKTLSQEIKRLQPIAKRAQYKEWRRQLKDEEYSKLGQSLIEFWRLADPTITTRYNERLIEHWKRIAYGREHFTRNGISAYDADERAEIYVKYGSPDLIRDGLISFSSGLVQSWIQQAFQIRLSDVGPLPSGTDSVSKAMAQQIMAARVMQKQDQIMDYERRVRFAHNYPSYEIWVYKDIVKNSYTPLIYIFGNDGNTGQFSMLESIEDMMPNSAFRSAGNQMEVPPSFFLQLMYYQNLVTIDNYFEQAYQQLESRLYTMQGVNRWDSRQLRYQNRNTLYHARMRAPEERSTLDKEFPAIPLDVHQYRLLNENNEPYLATYVLSNPYRAYLFDQLQDNDYDPSSYKLSGSVLGISKENEIAFQQTTDNQPLRGLRDFRGNIDYVQPEITYFEVPNTETVSNQRFAIELRHKNKDSTHVTKNVFKENIRAIGNVSTEQKEPISLEEGELQMGDLIVGIREDASDEKLPFGFRVEPDATIDKGENLVVHFEVYNLGGEQGAPEPFQIEYVAIEKIGLLKRIFTKRDKVRLSLNFESRGPHFRENLEIDTSPFEAGDYKLELTATEHGSNREVERSIEFTIEEVDEE